MQGAERAVWRATQAIRNAAARPSPARQMFKLLMNEPLVRWGLFVPKLGLHDLDQFALS
jgi:hypothetical protein